MRRAKRSGGKVLTEMFKINSTKKSRDARNQQTDSTTAQDSAIFEVSPKGGFHVRLVRDRFDIFVRSLRISPHQEWQRYGTAVLNCVLSFRAARMSGNRRRFRPVREAGVGRLPSHYLLRSCHSEGPSVTRPAAVSIKSEALRGLWLTSSATVRRPPFSRPHRPQQEPSS